MNTYSLPQGERLPLCRALLRFADTHAERAPEALRILHFVCNTPGCFRRSNAEGHITGSAWLLNPGGDKVLLTLHRKLGRWLQPGGHADGCADTPTVALREAEEESGITAIRPLSPDIFDVDIHLIPEHRQSHTPAHLHYDIRYLMQAPHTQFVISDESDDLRWWSAADILQHPELFDESVQRMARLHPQR